MDSAEQLLRYVHATAVAAGWDHSTKTKWHGKADIAIAESFANIAAAHKSKPPVEMVRESMLNGLDKMKRFDATVFKTAPPDGSKWIKFQSAHPQKASAAVATQTAVANDMDAKMNVLQFDEETGAQLNAQVTFEKTLDKDSVCIEVPWK